MKANQAKMAAIELVYTNPMESIRGSAVAEVTAQNVYRTALDIQMLKWFGWGGWGFLLLIMVGKIIAYLDRAMTSPPFDRRTSTR